MEPDYQALDPETRLNHYLAILSVATGVFGLCAGLIPICGAVISTAGIILGFLGMKSDQRKLAIAGLGLSVLSLLISVVYAIILVAQKS
jgi:hypothetical protein